MSQKVLYICKCGNEEFVSKMGFDQKKRCTPCANEKQRKVSRDHYWTKKKKAVKKGKKALCWCGCGRVRGTKNSLLSDKCYQDG